MGDRDYWLATMEVISEPVFQCLAMGRLKRSLPDTNPACQKNGYLEAFGRTAYGLCVLGVDYDDKRIERNVRQVLGWYKGDGIYGDGPWFHWDYYNSFVIQPMLLDIWLVPGVCGSQPGLAERYVNTGSLYLCTTVFLALGLPETDDFWKGEEEPWTSKKIFGGEYVNADRAIEG